tara:strand:- start:778 stop:951 length:174 start_codon:yes stop_codon:yes gene_type:complete
MKVGGILFKMTEQQFQQAKAELTDRWFQDESYTDDMYIADLKGLNASWLIACYNKTL